MFRFLAFTVSGRDVLTSCALLFSVELLLSQGLLIEKVAAYGLLNASLQTSAGCY